MVHIITDSSTLYSPEEARLSGFDAVPLCISIGGSNQRDLLLDMDEYYGKIQKGILPTSSQPPLGDVIDAFESYSDTDSQIINISMADGLSGTYQTACSAREMVKHKDQIVVFNSQTLCGPHRYMVEKAQKMKEEGRSFQEILDWLEQASRNTESFLIPQDFSFLRRGGRLTPLAAAIGSVLKLKPVVKTTDDGKRLDKFTIKRTLSSAVGSIIQYLKGRHLDGKHILYISHARAADDAEKVKAMFQQAFPELEIRILELSATFVAHGGPQCVAIQYIAK